MKKTFILIVLAVTLTGCVPASENKVVKRVYNHFNATSDSQKSREMPYVKGFIMNK